MSNHLTTQDTNPKSLETSSSEPIPKKRGRPKQQTFTINQVVEEKPMSLKLDATEIQKIKEENANRVSLTERLIYLDHLVQKCKIEKIEHLEVEEDILAHFCGGKVPSTGDLMYKDIRLVKGSMDEIRAREERNAYEASNPGDKGFKVYTSLKK